MAGRKTLTLLIVGGGPTGSLVAYLLSRRCPELSCTVWEKESEAGGRMNTYRAEKSEQQVDMGAQYITHFKNNDVTSPVATLKHQLYEELQQKRVLVPLTARIDGDRSTGETLGNFVSPQGINSVPRYFLDQAQATINYDTRLSQIIIDQSNRTTLCQSEDGEKHHFSAVVLTMPVLEAIRTCDGHVMDSEVRSRLDAVQYSSRYALAVFFRETHQTSWAAKYFDNSVVRFASWDRFKRSSHDDSEPSPLLLHSSVPFALQHWEDDDSMVQSTMLSTARELIPSLPVVSHCHLVRWKYSQVHAGYPGSPGCVALCQQPLVLLTGDAMTHSNFEGCIKAANSTVDTIAKHFLTK